LTPAASEPHAKGAGRETGYYVRGDRRAQKDLFIAMLLDRATTPTTWTVPNEPNAIRRLVRKLEREASGPVQACYEARPCGYVLQRQLSTALVTCQVIAPALIPRDGGPCRGGRRPRATADFAGACFGNRGGENRGRYTLSRNRAPR
jgi:hypothetical protein